MRAPPGGLLLAAVLSLAAAPARAETDPAKVARASELFDAGVQAYKAGLYAVASEAFLTANEIAPSPALLFSAAQAFRSQFVAEPSPITLRRAIALYRDDLRCDKPRRREDAMKALEALVPLEAQYPAQPPGDGGGGGAAGRAAAPASERARGTRLLLSTASEGAEVSVDGGPFVASPAMVKVAPGPHRVRVRAPGYEDEEVTAHAVTDELMPRIVALRPKPARLRVVGTAGARVAVDGQVRATLPTATPISVEPGEHFVTVTLPGHEPYGKEITLARDTPASLEARLPLTRQRVAAVASLSLGAAGAAAAVVLASVAVARQNEALDVSTRLQATPLGPADRDRYNVALSARNQLAQASAITGGAATLVAAVGLGLFVLDRPEAPPPPDDRRGSPLAPAPRTELEVGLLSVRVRVRF